MSHNTPQVSYLDYTVALRDLVIQQLKDINLEIDSLRGFSSSVDKKHTVRPKTLYLVCGQLCSGKGTYCSLLPSSKIHLTTSDIVKKVTNQNTRSQLSQTGDWSDRISHEILNQITSAFKDTDIVVLEGIRQPQILDVILNRYNTDGNPVRVEMIWLQVPEWIRKFRFMRRQDIKDDISFEAAQQGDIDLGLERLFEQNRSNFTTINNYSKEEAQHVYKLFHV